MQTAPLQHLYANEPLNEAYGEFAEPKYCIMRTRVRIYLDDILRLLGPQNV